MISIESTYLAKELPELSKLKSSEIEQGYLSNHEDATRVRKIGDKYFITRKLMAIPGDKRYREQFEVEITKEEFDRIWKVVTKTIKKKRYAYKDEPNLEIMIDEFEGDLKGLYLVEVSSVDEGTAKSYKRPEWFGEEVTETGWATNQSLAGKKFADIAKFVNKINIK